MRIVASRCSTSRKITVAPATTIASPLASAISGTSRGIAIQNVERVSGRTMRLIGTTMSSSASRVVRFVATTASGSSWRGKRTCFTRFACPSRLVDDICTDDWKNVQLMSPEMTNSG